jgi:hypothetical protein
MKKASRRELQFALILSQSGASVLLFIMVLIGLIVMATAATNSMIRQMAKTSGSARKAYEVSYAMESIAGYLRDAYDRGNACTALGSLLTCVAPNYCDVYAPTGTPPGTVYSSLFDTAVPGVGRLYCLTRLNPNPCAGNAGALGVEFTDYTGAVKTVCLAVSNTDLSHLNIYVENIDLLKASSTEWAGLWRNLDLEIIGSTANAGSSPYAGLANKNTVPIANAPALINSTTPGLSAVTAPPRLAPPTDCTTVGGIPGTTAEQCEQLCRPGNRCLRVAICLPSDTACNPTVVGGAFATINFKFLDPTMNPP